MVTVKASGVPIYVDPQLKSKKDQKSTPELGSTGVATVGGFTILRPKKRAPQLGQRTIALRTFRAVWGRMGTTTHL
jgi:hypothetical protein